MKTSLKTRAILATVLVTSCVITPALATVGNIAQIQEPLSAQVTAEQTAKDNLSTEGGELAYAFDDSEALQIQAMSETEMQETQGAFWGVVVKVALAIIMLSLKSSSNQNNQ